MPSPTRSARRDRSTRPSAARRKPRTISGLGGPDNIEDYPGYQNDSTVYDFNSGDSYGWVHTADPNIIKTEVPNGTPLDPRVIGVAVNHPRQGTTTWTAPTTEAIAQGKLQAAVDTIAATGAQLTAAGESILGVAGAVVQNLPLILLGVAALFLIFQMEKSK